MDDRPRQSGKEKGQPGFPQLPDPREREPGGQEGLSQLHTITFGFSGQALEEDASGSTNRQVRFLVRQCASQVALLHPKSYPAVRYLEAIPPRKPQKSWPLFPRNHPSESTHS